MQTSLFEPQLKVHHIENNADSQATLNEFKQRITNDCRKVLNLLLAKHELTVLKCAIGIYHEGNHIRISSLPRRVKDLTDNNGIKISKRKIEGGVVVYYMTDEDIFYNKRLLNLLKPNN